MLDHLAQFTAWPIVTGIIVGYIANRIMSGEGKGCCLEQNESSSFSPLW